jgi:IS30 family transposase
MHLSYTVRPGGLSEADREQIFALADKGMKCGPIARRIEKHPATVRWFMYRNGLAQPVRRKSIPTAHPDARGRKGYSPEEDAALLEMRSAGIDLRVIAERMTERFGHRRTRHGVEVRLIMLAASDDDLGEAA